MTEWLNPDRAAADGHGADIGQAAGLADDPGFRRTMDVKPVSITRIGHGDDHGPTVGHEAHMRDQPLIEDRMGNRLILHLALHIADFREIGLVGHDGLLRCCLRF